MRSQGGGRPGANRRLMLPSIGSVGSRKAQTLLVRTALAVGALSVALLGFALADSVASSTQPLVQQAPKLIGGEAESGEGRLGQSAALSADGNTALVGAPNDEGKRGAVCVFTR